VPALSIIVPVRNGASFLRRTLPALLAVLEPGDEVIVSDDGSTDGSADVARGHGARVVSHAPATGPAGARNRGAEKAGGEVFVFLDADVRVHPDTLARLKDVLKDPEVAGAFGSYDATPEARSWISLYKNLAHHFVHQRSAREASTFWAGCGAIRSQAFRHVGGFDESYRRPSIEDVELGYRLRAAGCRLRLVPEAQVTHLKEWSWSSWLRADIFDRAVPWSRLLARGLSLPRDLNFTAADRAASALVAAGLLGIVVAMVRPPAVAAAALAFALAIVLDGPFLRFAARTVSLPFAAAAAILQLVHRAAGLLGLAIGMAVPRSRVASTTTTT
jgi:GT2 family glycosyltransferase